MANPETLAEATFVTYANLPERSIPTWSGPEPLVKKGEPEMGVRKPEDGSTENAGTSPAFATYTNLPVGCTLTPSGKSKVGKGEPRTSVKAPVAGSIRNADRLPKTEVGGSPIFATYKNLPEGSGATSTGCNPAANGEPRIDTRLPVAASMA